MTTIQEKFVGYFVVIAIIVWLVVIVMGRYLDD
jgi:hypothetical protein